MTRTGTLPCDGGDVVPPCDAGLECIVGQCIDPCGPSVSVRCGEIRCEVGQRCEGGECIALVAKGGGRARDLPGHARLVLQRLGDIGLRRSLRVVGSRRA